MVTGLPLYLNWSCGYQICQSSKKRPATHTHRRFCYYSGGSCSEISLEMEFLWQFFNFSKSGPWHPKNGTKLKFDKNPWWKHAPKFQFQVRNSWVWMVKKSILVIFKNISSLTKSVTLLLDMLETWFWCQTPGFWVWGIIWDHFQKPQIDLKAKNWVDGL